MARSRPQTPSRTESVITASFAATCFALFLFNLYFDKAPIITSVIGSTAVTVLMLVIANFMRHHRSHKRDLALTHNLSPLPPAQFELAVAELFRAEDYSGIVSGGANDRGIDIILDKDGEKAVV